ncbi:MAG: type I restriction endonuclease subunit R [Nitrospiria bacterium]
MSEAQTRQEIIDKRLEASGWNVKDPALVTSEHPILHQFGSLSKTGFCDYLLFARDGSPLAVVEAKRSTVDAEIGREQAKQYADGLEKMGHPRPFIFYTNGNNLFFWDDSRYPPRKIYGFYAQADLERLRFQNLERKPLSTTLIDTKIAGRPYQIEAIRRTLETLTQGHRKALLVMATGTGKTRVAVALIDVLMRCNWVKRILFLADRNELLKQARNAFKEHLPNATWARISSKEPLPEKRVYLSTYPTMHGLYPTISPGYFDMVVADESHRSIYNRYKEILDHFDAYLLGLTATPVEYIDRNTFQLFETPNEDPTFNYTLEEAVKNAPPYLVPFKVLSIQSRFQLEGIKAGQLPVQIQKKLIEEGKDLEDIDFEGTDLEKQVTNSGTNELIVREFMEQCIKDETGTRPGKSIIFAISHQHALRLEEHFNRLYPEYKGRLARVIDSHDPRAGTEGGLIDQFKDPKDLLKVAISVDMLDTGIDIPEVVNLIFAKPVFSRAKFWQMIGRGTRLCPNLFGQGENKAYFLIIDHWKNFAYFQMNPPGKEPSPTLSLPERLFGVRLDKATSALTVGDQSVLEKTISAIRADIASLPKGTVRVKEKAQELSVVAEETAWYGFGLHEIENLRKNILPLMRTRSAEDFDALRFDIDIIVTQTALLDRDEETLGRMKETIREKIDALPLTLNQVRAEEETIRKIKEERFWTALSEETLEEVRVRLRGLMKLQQKKINEMEKLNLEDITLVKEWVEFGPEMERATTLEYRRKVEEKINSLLIGNEVLQKLKRGEPVDDYDISRLAELLRSEDPYVTEEVLQRVYDNKNAHFIDFVRYILGIQKLQSRSEIIAQAFDDFIAHHNDYSANQVEFLQIIKTFILNQGKVEKENLINRPFTNFHPQGIRGVFQLAQIDEILEFVSKIG